MELTIVINDGLFDNELELKNAISTLKNGTYRVSIKRINTRSIAQNSYLHGVLFPIVLQELRNLGYDEIKDNEDVKQFLKKQFLKNKKTRDLSKSEMKDFIEQVIKWGAEYLSVQIPYPNEKI